VITLPMLCAILDGQDYPPAGVPDTPLYRAVWDRVAAQVAELIAAGIIPDIPGGASLVMPGDDDGEPQASDWHHGGASAGAPGLSPGKITCPREDLVSPGRGPGQAALAGAGAGTSSPGSAFSSGEEIM
jgi:hypothetical protein